MRTTLFISVVFFLLDQVSKSYVLGPLNLDDVGVIEIFDPYLMFKMAWNEGINFGLFANGADTMRWVLTAFAVVVSGYLLWWSRQYSGWMACLCVGMVVGGALGNALDRVIYGAVVDFLNMSCCGIYNPYVFNLADVWVFAGIIGIILFSERFQKRA
ncbi:lipoprotein signal peptidase [Amylibacter marinus]|uniref:Lipoprotein signal peptidase n=1 Tax=Amylibacter marinus TaxID=1475483 RepID=A0ABQ5VWH5_9RHOB|nr:signal peptidase II [Amylibacter marinus]GLQ35765.1 lipoprotein signal peptidase [Amylibacter marinus]